MTFSWMKFGFHFYSFSVTNVQGFLQWKGFHCFMAEIKCFTNLKLADSWFVFCSLFLISVEIEVLQNVD